MAKIMVLADLTENIFFGVSILNQHIATVDSEGAYILLSSANLDNDTIIFENTKSKVPSFLNCSCVITGALFSETTIFL